MQRRYITVDVFTDRAFGGNPLAVVLDAGGLSTAQMQAIATEFNYSETTFVLPPRDAANDAWVRIFTVNRELPFAGHPNVGTAFVLASRAAKPPARLKFEEGAGLVPVEILTARGQGRRHRADRAEAAQQIDAVQRRAGRGLSFIVGGRYQDRPASAANCLGRAAVPDGRSNFARRVAPRQARCRGICRRVPLRRLRCGLFLYPRCPRRGGLRSAGADVSSRRQRPLRRPRHRQRHRGRRSAARRSCPPSGTANSNCASARVSTWAGPACC